MVPTPIINNVALVFYTDGSGYWKYKIMNPKGQNVTNEHTTGIPDTWVHQGPDKSVNGQGFYCEFYNGSNRKALLILSNGTILKSVDLTYAHSTGTYEIYGRDGKSIIWVHAHPTSGYVLNFFDGTYFNTYHYRDAVHLDVNHLYNDQQDYNLNDENSLINGTAFVGVYHEDSTYTLSLVHTRNFLKSSIQDGIMPGTQARIFPQGINLFTGNLAESYIPEPDIYVNGNMIFMPVDNENTEQWLEFSIFDNIGNLLHYADLRNMNFTDIDYQFYGTNKIQITFYKGGDTTVPWTIYNFDATTKHMVTTTVNSSTYTERIVSSQYITPRSEWSSNEMYHYGYYHGTSESIVNYFYSSTSGGTNGYLTNMSNLLIVSKLATDTAYIHTDIGGTIGNVYFGSDNYETFDTGTFNSSVFIPMTPTSQADKMGMLVLLPGGQNYCYTSITATVNSFYEERFGEHATLLIYFDTNLDQWVQAIVGEQQILATLTGAPNGTNFRCRNEVVNLRDWSNGGQWIYNKGNATNWQVLDKFYSRRLYTIGGQGQSDEPYSSSVPRNWNYSSNGNSGYTYPGGIDDGLTLLISPSTVEGITGPSIRVVTPTSISSDLILPGSTSVSGLYYCGTMIGSKGVMYWYRRTGGGITIKIYDLDLVLKQTVDTSYTDFVREISTGERLYVALTDGSTIGHYTCYPSASNAVLSVVQTTGNGNSISSYQDWDTSFNDAWFWNAFN